MKKSKLYIIVFVFIILLSAFIFIDHYSRKNQISNFIVDLKCDDLIFFYKNKKGEKIKSLGNLIKHTKQIYNRELVFVMNAGMYMENNIPLGLSIIDGEIISPINRYIPQKNITNFYLKPNGIFYLTNNNEATICKTEKFKFNNVKYATQSGPLLLINGEINPIFKQDSENLNIRNGVGILDNNKVVFAISEYKINFYEFAEYFKKIGCKDALFLDGYVSQAYIPSKNLFQTGGDFGVMIGVVK